MGRESVHVGWDRVEMKRGAMEKNLEAPEVEDSRIFGQFLVINFWWSIFGCQETVTITGGKLDRIIYSITLPFGPSRNNNKVI